MQWGSSNLKTQGQPNVLAGVEARPSQRKYKQDIKTKNKKTKKKKKLLTWKSTATKKEEKETSPKRERNGRRS